MTPTPADSSSLHAQIRARFETAFGEPHYTFAADAHWRLRPQSNMVSINIVLNGDDRQSALWVFDPHDREGGVMNASITSLAEADELIRQIHERIRRAASKRNEGGSR